MPDNSPSVQVEQVKALQYLFDVARTAAAPAAVHEQVQKYALFLNQSFVPAPVDVAPKKPVSLAAVVEQAKQAAAAAAPAEETVAG